jgi:hypothetical protein
MEEKGLVTPAERAQFLADWEARKREPHVALLLADRRRCVRAEAVVGRG